MCQMGDLRLESLMGSNFVDFDAKGVAPAEGSQHFLPHHDDAVRAETNAAAELSGMFSASRAPTASSGASMRSSSQAPARRARRT